MKKVILQINNQNNSWILHREEVYTPENGSCNIYFLLDTYSGFCFGRVISRGLPPASYIVNLLKHARIEMGRWPTQILIDKRDPYVETLKSICQKFKINVNDLSSQDLKQFLQSFLNSFNKFKLMYQEAEMLPEIEGKALETAVPDLYDLCPCASGKKFKLCCQKSFYDISFAMCAAEEGDLAKALYYMKAAESKIGKTAEILCRYAICWSYFDQKKFHQYLAKALKINPNHPRTNYILGIGSRAKGQYLEAIEYYQKAIAHYPKDARYYLNESYNNLGSVYLDIGRYRDAKEAWEKAFVFFPDDPVVKRNLIEFICENPEIPINLRKINPFIRKRLFN